MENLNEYERSNIVIHCPTLEEFLEINRLFNGNLGSMQWDTYRGDTYYHAAKNQYADIGFYTRNGYSIVECSEVFQKAKESQLEQYEI